MNGSPPLSRTTVRPRRARSMSMAQISSWVDGVVGFLLADVDALGVRGGEVEQGGGREVVVEDGVGLFQDAAALDGEQFGIARAGADQSRPSGSTWGRLHLRRADRLSETSAAAPVRS